MSRLDLLFVLSMLWCVAFVGALAFALITS
jgi:hypothetical protein